MKWLRRAVPVLGVCLAAVAVGAASGEPPLPMYRIDGAETVQEVWVHPVEGDPFAFSEGQRPVSVIYWYPDDGSGADVTREDLVEHGVTCGPGDRAESVEDVRDSRMWVFFFKCVGMR